MKNVVSIDRYLSNLIHDNLDRKPVIEIVEEIDEGKEVLFLLEEISGNMEADDYFEELSFQEAA